MARPDGDPSARQLAETLDLIDDAVLLLDDEGRVTYLNAAARTLLGERALDHHLMHLMAPLDPALPQVLRAVADRVAVHGCATMVLAGDGLPRAASITLQPLACGGLVLRLRSSEDRQQRQSALSIAQQTVDGSPMGMMVFDGATGRCLHANTAAARISGGTLYDLQRQSLDSLGAWSAPALQRDARAVLEDGTPRGGEVRTHSAFGRSRWISYALTRITATGCYRLQLTIDDISSRKRSEIERDQRLALFAAVIEQSPSITVLTDAGRNITYLNPAFTTLTGIPIGDMLGRHAMALVYSGEADPSVVPGRRALDRGESWHGEIGLRRADGTPLWVDGVVSPLRDEAGAIIAYVAVHRDVTALKQAQAEARARSEELIQADKLSALGELVAGIGHELSNPANFISLNAPLLRDLWMAAQPVLDTHAAGHPGLTLDGLSYPRARELAPQLFNGIDEGVSRIRRLIGELREFARPAVAATSAESLDLDRVVTAAVDITRHTITNATRTLTMDLHGSLPVVRGSFQKLEQVVINLVLNACQALTSRDQGLAISTSCDADRQQVVIRVSDEGVGIPQDILHRLGEPFFTTRRDQGGTGLGLSIIRRIIHDHDGTLSFASTPGRGTTVTVTLPAGSLQVPNPAPG